MNRFRLLLPSSSNLISPSLLSLPRSYASKSRSLNPDGKVGIGLDWERFKGIIPEDQIEKQFIRSSGPGGQNVNKRNTQCVIKFNVREAKWIPPVVKERFMEKYKNMITRKDICQIRSDAEREPDWNLQLCMDKLKSYLIECQNELIEENTPPTPEEIQKMKEDSERGKRYLMNAKRKIQYNRKCKEIY